MRLRGTIRDSKTRETLPQANVYVSDSKGKLLTPTKGTSTDFDGKFRLDDLKPSDYVSMRFVGYNTLTYKVSDLGSGVTISKEFLMQPSTAELEEFAVVEYRDKPIESAEPIGFGARKKRNYTPFIIGGIALVVIVGGIVTYRIAKSK